MRVRSGSEDPRIQRDLVRICEELNVRRTPGTQDLGDLRIRGFEKPSICRFKIPKIESLKILGLDDLEISDSKNSRIQRFKDPTRDLCPQFCSEGFEDSRILESARPPGSTESNAYPSIQGSGDPREKPL
ncbi:hypothetical protein RF55_5807 [Lasius niger]|uniref:Uncharacterized protein n=1 Tax=Lasius niger TaxID=67767 RepID=A0A0J7KUV0_LASNI|nr:hypothetical protein RF55_5807 [Lasius niger]